MTTINEGEWVAGITNYKKFTGFVNGIVHDDLVIYVPSFKDNPIIVKGRHEVVPLNDVNLGMDELTTLSDLALATKDKEWFNDIYHEMSLWKGVNDIEWQ